MTHRQDVAFSRDIMARWCALAEQRLEHLTELFESGRWRRYHSERAFLENVQEAKRAVETWRDLSTRPYMQERTARSERGAPAIAAAPAAIETAAPAPVIEFVPRERIAPQPAQRFELTLDLDGVTERYPLLRNAL